MSAGTHIKTENHGANPTLPEANYMGQYKDGKHVYKNKYTEEWYKVYSVNGNWMVEFWEQGCGCD